MGKSCKLSRNGEITPLYIQIHGNYCPVTRTLLLDCCAGRQESRQENHFSAFPLHQIQHIKHIKPWGRLKMFFEGLSKVFSRLVLKNNSCISKGKWLSQGQFLFLFTTQVSALPLYILMFTCSTSWLIIVHVRLHGTALQCVISCEMWVWKQSE